jgi:arsenate reductase
MEKTKVLFVCEHNSARSQIAEALVNHNFGDKFQAESAGLESSSVNPLAIKSMEEINIDISKNQSKKVFDLFKAGNKYDYVITVCDEAAGEKCPVFPGKSNRLHWSFADPSLFKGSDEEKLQKTNKVRDEIKSKIDAWVSTM